MSKNGSICGSFCLALAPSKQHKDPRLITGFNPPSVISQLNKNIMQMEGERWFIPLPGVTPRCWAHVCYGGGSRASHQSWMTRHKFMPSIIQQLQQPTSFPLPENSSAASEQKGPRRWGWTGKGGRGSFDQDKRPRVAPLWPSVLLCISMAGTSSRLHTHTHTQRTVFKLYILKRHCLFPGVSC